MPALLAAILPTMGVFNMVKTTRAQREALFKVFQRDFPGWRSPTTRDANHSKGKACNVPHIVKVPSIQWRRFRNKVQPGPGCVMLPWANMWLGIEPDGYTHS
jgi:hypothetical protein